MRPESPDLTGEAGQGGTPEETPYQRAKRRIDELRGFYSHVAVFLIINAFLLLLNLISNSESLWFYWPLLGWGLLLTIHGFFVFGSNLFLGKDWEDRKMRELLEHDPPSTARSNAPVR